MVPVTCDAQEANRIFLDKPILLKRLNNALRNVMAIYSSGDRYLALYIVSSEQLDTAIAILLRPQNDALILDDVILASEFPKDAAITPTSLPQYHVDYSSDKIHTLSKQDDFIVSSQHTGGGLAIRSTHMPLETTHGRWLMPKGLRYHHCFKETNTDERVRVEEFLFSLGTYYCPETVKAFSKALEKETLFYKDSNRNRFVLFKGQERMINRIFLQDNYSIHAFTDTDGKEVLVDYNGDCRSFDLDQDEWHDFIQTFNLNIGKECIPTRMPVKLMKQAFEIPVHTRIEQLSEFVAIPKLMMEFLEHKGVSFSLGGNRTIEKQNRAIASPQDTFELVKVDKELFLHRQLKWRELYIKVEPGDNYSLKAVDAFTLDAPLDAQKVLNYKKHMRDVNEAIKLSQCVEPVKCQNMDSSLVVKHENLGLNHILDEEIFTWNLYQAYGNDASSVYLHGQSTSKHIVFHGKLVRDGKATIHVQSAHQRAIADVQDSKQYVQEVAQLEGRRAYLPEFTTVNDLSDFQPQDEFRNVHQAMSIFSNAYHNKNDARVDLKVRYNNEVRSFSYGFVDTDSIPSRYLKAAIEAMAIRHVLIEHFSTKKTILKGSQHLRLDLSSKMLFDTLKGDQSIPEELRSIVRYIRTRSYSGKLTHDAEPPKQQGAITRLIDLNQPHDVMEFDESLKMRTGNYYITYHAVERSDQRMFNERWHTGWGFIASQILRSLSHDGDLERLSVRRNGESTVYTNEDNWNFALKPGNHPLVKTVATIYEGISPEQLHQNARSRAILPGATTEQNWQCKA
jgi:hypothetical protein